MHYYNRIEFPEHESSINDMLPREKDDLLPPRRFFMIMGVFAVMCSLLMLAGLVIDALR